MISVVIPYKEDPYDDGYRKKNFDYVKKQFKWYCPEAEIIIGEDTSGEKDFCRSHSINDGVHKSKGDILIITDCDILINKQIIDRAINQLSNSPFVIPFGRCLDFTPECTDKILENHNFEQEINIEKYEEQARLVRDIRKGNGKLIEEVAGGISVMTRKFFDEIGGFDERFTGYAYEDTMFCLKAKKLLGNYSILEDEWIGHLWHLRNFRLNFDNKKLYEEEKQRLENE